MNRKRLVIFFSSFIFGRFLNMCFNSSGEVETVFGYFHGSTLRLDTEAGPADGNGFIDDNLFLLIQVGKLFSRYGVGGVLDPGMAG